MDLEQLKSDWNKISTPEKDTTELKKMLSENSHPVLKGIRRQLTIELIGWSAFLLCYYTMFDGDQKPLYINVLLVVSVSLSLLHNVSGYWSSKYLMQGNDLLISLKQYLNKMKVYAAVSICSRALFAAGLLLFFCYNIRFDSSKYLALGLAIVVMLIQLIFLSALWKRRLSALKSSIAGF